MKVQMTNTMLILVYCIALVVIMITIFYARVRDRDKPVIKQLTHIGLIVSCWLVFEMLFYWVDSEPAALWFHDAKLIFVAFTPVFFILMAIKFYNEDYSRRLMLIIGLVCVIPSITAVLAVASPFHDLLRSEIYITQNAPLRTTYNIRGVWFWVHSVHSYLLIATAAIIIFYQHNKLPKGLRTPSTLIATGSVLTLLGSLIVVLTPNYSMGIDFTLLGVSSSVIFFYAGISVSDKGSLLYQAYDNTFYYIEDYLFVLDDKRQIMETNPAAKRWLQHIGIDNKINSFDDLLDKLINTAAADDEPRQDYHLLIDQQVYYYSLTEQPITNKSGRELGVLAIFTDITRYKLLIDRVEQAAGLDHLTGLGNRRSYEQALKILDKPSSLPLSVILGDVNGLKYVNDNMGHAEGDALLNTIAQVLSDACPKDARAYRIGGDEFILLLPCTSLSDAEAVEAKIRDVLTCKSLSSPFRISISLGIATKETDEQDILECIALADNNMYLDKQNDRRAARRD